MLYMYNIKIVSLKYDFYCNIRACSARVIILLAVEFRFVYTNVQCSRIFEYIIPGETYFIHFRRSLFFFFFIYMSALQSTKCHRSGCGVIAALHRAVIVVVEPLHVLLYMIYNRLVSYTLYKSCVIFFFFFLNTKLCIPTLRVRVGGTSI